MSSKRITRTQLDELIAVYKSKNNKMKKELLQEKKPVWIITGNCTFAKVKSQVEHMSGVLADSAERDWNAQKIRPSKRKVSVFIDGAVRHIELNNIRSGASAVVPITDEQKQVGHRKRFATHIAKDEGQKNWKEASSIRTFLDKMEWGPKDPKPIPMFDGLNADMCFEMAPNECVGAQFKSGEFNGGPVNLTVEKKDGAPGAKYANLGIVGIIFEAVSKEDKDTHMADFNGLPPVKIVELFLLQNASEMDGASLHPSIRNPKQKANNDRFRWTTGYDGYYDDIDWVKYKACFVDILHKLPRHSLYFFRYQDCSKSAHMVEVKNIEVLEGLLGGEEYIVAYERQNETIDLIAIVDDIAIKTSVKTATINGKEGSYKFQLEGAPYWWHCDVVTIFYKDADGTRTHVSILDSRRVYNRSDETFNWSSNNNKDVLLDRIDLTDEDAAEQVKYTMLEIKKTLDNTFFDTGRKASRKAKKAAKRNANAKTTASSKKQKAM